MLQRAKKLPTLRGMFIPRKGKALEGDDLSKARSTHEELIASLMPESLAEGKEE